MVVHADEALAAGDSEIFKANDSSRETLTIEEAIDRVVVKVTLKMVLIFGTACLTIVNAGSATYLTVFTGHIPYNEWTCLSKKCFNILKSSDQSSEDFYSYETMCENDLVAGSDFKWTSKMQTFSMDWDFYCGNEAKLSVLSSVFFVGTFLGLICSTGLYERLGRKRGATIGSFMVLVAVFLSSVANNYWVLLLLRFIYGLGQSTTYMGSYCWIVELAPTYLRNHISNLFGLGWSVGVFALIGISYFIHQWQYVYVAVACMNAVAILPFFLLPLPESPRFSLLKGREEEAKKTLRLLAEMNGSKASFENVDLVYEKRNQFYLQQVKDFKYHPTMLKETVIGMIAWFTVGLVSYSYQFGWSKMGNDLHSIYFFSALGEGISYVICVPCCQYLGRKRATLFFFALVIVMNAIASLDIKFSHDWSLETLASIFGSMGSAAAFVMMYLYSGELAPTSHRGMIMCLCSSCARTGSFIGPYVNLLYGLTDRRVPLTLFAGLSLLACVAVWFLPDTTGRSVPETPEDVEILSRKKKLEGQDEDKEAKHVVVNRLNGCEQE